MKLMVTGHRIEKLSSYDIDYIKEELTYMVAYAMTEGFSLGLSGMASGVDLWFCQACLELKMPYIACVPFEDQDKFMSPDWANSRQNYLNSAKEIRKVRNSHMVEACDGAIVVWDGNKGGTHNCFQQLLETKKQVWWMIPQKYKVVEI